MDTDDKATPADVTRADIDALVTELREFGQAVTVGWLSADRYARAAAALAAERDRADRAEELLTPVRDEATPASTEKPPVSLTHRLMLDLIDMEDDAAVAKFARNVIPKMIDELTAYAADSDQLVEAWEEGYWAANDDWNEAPGRDVATPNPYRSEATA